MKYTPKIRFQRSSGLQYSDWVGVRLGDVAVIEKGQQKNRSTLLASGKYPVINGGKEPSGYTDDAWNTPANTIVISEGGACGYVNRIGSRFWCGAHCYKVLQPKLDHSFLFHYLKFREPEIQRLRTGTGLTNIGKESLENFLIYVPTSGIEQRRIGSLFDAITQRIDLLNEQLRSFREYGNEILEQLLFESTQDDRRKRDHKLYFLRKNKAPYPKWEEVTFGSIAHRVNDQTECKKNRKEILIGLKDIEKKTGRILRSQKFDSVHGKKRAFKSGDVLFGRLRPNLKKYAFPTFDGVCEPEILVLRGNGISNQFLYYLIQTEKFHRHSVSSVTGTRMPRVDWEALEKIKFRIPCPEEQNLICSFLSIIDKKISLLQCQNEDFEIFRLGLMQRSMKP